MPLLCSDIKPILDFASRFGARVMLLTLNYWNEVNYCDKQTYKLSPPPESQYNLLFLQLYFHNLFK